MFQRVPNQEIELASGAIIKQKMPQCLYLCYFGVREPLVQTQVLPYLRELMKVEIGEDAGSIFPMDVTLLTFEPTREAEDLAEFSVIREKLAAEGIDWDWLPYHKRPSAVATAWDILRGTIRVWRMHRRASFDVLHCRVHVPGVMGAVARKFSRKKPKLLFDIRGFFPEEFVDAGIWRENGYIYRTAKCVEQWLMKESDGFVVLTEKAREILFPESRNSGFDFQGRPVEVIPCCVDLQRFAVAMTETRLEMRTKLGIDNRKVMAYVGSFGGWYLTQETFDLFSVARRLYPNVFALIITQGKAEMAEALLRKAGFGCEDMFIGRIETEEVPKYLVAADLAVSLIKPCYSKLSSSPTKNAEYLASGLPIIANAGIGDVDSLIRINGVGALLTEFNPAGYSAALEEIDRLGNIAEKCRQTAAREFDLGCIGGMKYRRLYSRMLKDSK